MSHEETVISPLEVPLSFGIESICLAVFHNSAGATLPILSPAWYAAPPSRTLLTKIVSIGSLKGTNADSSESAIAS